MENNNTNNTGGQNKIMAAIIVAGVLIAGAILLTGTNPPEKIVANDLGMKDLNGLTEIRPVVLEEHVFGNPNAEVFIVEYSDTECPFCKMFHNTMHEIVDTYEGKVAWVYRHYPIPELHEKAFNEAAATECAWEQGGNETFWKYTDEVYNRTNSNDTLAPSELPKIAQEIGLELNKFNDCLTTQKYSEKVQNDILDGEKVRINGTPNSFIVKNGVVVDIIQGAAPIGNVKAKIDRALQ